jgi:hypothetical protein
MKSASLSSEMTIAICFSDADGATWYDTENGKLSSVIEANL